MRNWLELQVLGRERMAETVRCAGEARSAVATTGMRSQQPATLLLSRGEVLSLRVGKGGLVVTCITGRAWATGDRSKVDAVLLPGQSVEYEWRESVVIEAFRTAAVRIHSGQTVRVSVGMAMRPALA